MTEIDRAYRGAQAGDEQSFAAWVGLVELGLRAALRSFARAVDVEAVLQETLVRMWRAAPALRLEGTEASLRYACRIARNLAIQQVRRTHRFVELPPDALEDAAEAGIPPGRDPEPGLREAIVGCVKQLPGKPLQALKARLEDGGRRSDRELAAAVRMTVNTFLQNIVRARAAVSECLRRAGYPVEEYLR